MVFAHQRIGLRGYYGEAFQCGTFGLLPGFPESSHKERFAAVYLKVVRLVDSVLAFPFEEAVCWNEATTPLVGSFEAWFFADGLSSGVDQWRRFHGFRPIRNETPAHAREFKGFVIGRLFANDDSLLRRGDIEARFPLGHTLDRIVEGAFLYGCGWFFECKASAHILASESCDGVFESIQAFLKRASWAAKVHANM